MKPTLTIRMWLFTADYDLRIAISGYFGDRWRTLTNPNITKRLEDYREGDVIEMSDMTLTLGTRLGG